jgi:nucleoside phosphorylase
MADPQLTAPALLAHVFLRRGEDMLAPTQRLVSAWTAVIRRFDLDQGIPALGVPSLLPRGYRLTPGQLGLVAAAESGRDSVWQACAWANHGVLGVSVMMAPPRDRHCQGAWADLERGWKEALAAGPQEGVLGEARLFLALLAGTSGAGLAGPDETAAAAEQVRATAPEPSAPGWWRRWDPVPLRQPDGSQADELLVWEIGPWSSDGRDSRRLACIAPERSEQAADRLLWTAGDGTPRPLTRHLAHAAGLRYQVSVYDGGAPTRALRDEIGRLVDDLPAAAGGDPGTGSPTELAAALLRARAATISLRRRLAAMRRAVGALDENLRQALPMPDGPASGPLSDDRDLAAWLQRRLDQEIAMIDESAASAAAAAGFLAGNGDQTPAPLAAVVPGPGSRLRAPRAPAATASRPAGPGHFAPAGRMVVVFTAIGVEYRAVREYLGAVRRYEQHGMLYELGALPGVRGGWQIALAETGPGSTAAGLQLDRAVRVFDPEIAIFLGVAGGRKDVAHGDVVVADAIYDYELGKSTLEGFEPRMRTHHPAHRLLQWARLVAREEKWQQRIRPPLPDRPPQCYVKPIVTGAKVITHDQSDSGQLISRYAGDAVAVETEGHGFLEAAYVNPRVDALVIRGISDLLSDKDKHGDERWQPIASSHAAAFAIEFLNSIGESGT